MTRRKFSVNEEDAETIKRYLVKKKLSQPEFMHRLALALEKNPYIFDEKRDSIKEGYDENCHYEPQIGEWVSMIPRPELALPTVKGYKVIPSPEWLMAQRRIQIEKALVNTLLKNPKKMTKMFERYLIVLHRQGITNPELSKKAESILDKEVYGRMDRERVRLQKQIDERDDKIWKLEEENRSLKEIEDKIHDLESQLEIERQRQEGTLRNLKRIYDYLDIASGDLKVWSQVKELVNALIREQKSLLHQ